jgi:hypothetical protein
MYDGSSCCRQQVLRKWCSNESNLGATEPATSLAVHNKLKVLPDYNTTTTLARCARAV